MKLILDLSLYNSRLGDGMQGIQILGVGQYWVDFYESNITFNPHFIVDLQAVFKDARCFCL